MEIFQLLPTELKNYILYKCGGLENKTSSILKEFLYENKFWKNEVFKEPNFYEYLKLCNILKPFYRLVILYDEDGDYIQYPLDYHYD
jgi:hypothetical protein